MDVGRAPTDAIGRLSKPVIAAVRGFALGGGFELVLACDLVVAAENARFGLPEPRLGLAPGGGGTQRLPRIVGKARAFEVLLTGRVLTGQEAYEWGIANRVVPKDDLLAVAEELAARDRSRSRPKRSRRSSGSLRTASRFRLPRR